MGADPGAGKKGSRCTQSPGRAAQPPRGHTSPVWHPQHQSHEPTLQRNSKVGKHLLRTWNPPGWPGVCSSHKPPWHVATPWPTLGVPGAGARLHPGSFMGTGSPGGGSHLQTPPFGALQPPVQRSKISNPFNEASGKITPLKSLRPWQQLTQDPSSLLLFYLLLFKINNITDGANYFPA